MNEELESHPLIEDPAPFGVSGAKLSAQIARLEGDIRVLKRHLKALRQRAGEEALRGVVFGPARQR